MRFLDNDKDSRNKKKKNGKDNLKKQDQTIYYNILSPNGKVQCDCCEKDITKYVKIITEQNDYCVACFVNLDQYPKSYTVLNKLNFPIFEIDWSAQEELLMMQALEKHGFGNWNDIAEQIGTDKTPADIEKHYQDIFMDSPKFIPNKKQILTQRDSKTMKLTLPKSAKTENKKGKKIKEQAQISPNSINQQRGKGPSNTQNVNQQPITTTNSSQIVGFMPKRGDFEVQYDNEAELLLAEMEFNDDDTEDQKEMKYKILQIYNYRLSERIKRKDFVISRQLLDVKLQSHLQKNRGKQQREIYNSMKVFARFNPPQQHQKLVEGIIREKQIRQRLEQLRHYKKMGLKTLNEVEEHLQQKRKRQQKNKKQKPGQNGYLFDKGNSKGASSRRMRGNSNQGGGSLQKYSSGLTFDQNKLCEDFGITPTQYIVIKETLLRQSLKYGSVKKDGVDKFFKIDKSKVNGIYDFLVQNDTISTK